MDESGDLTEFEQRRLAHVCRTSEYMQLLGVCSHESLVPPQRLKRSLARDGTRTLDHATDSAEAGIVEASRNWMCKSRAVLVSPGLGGAIPTSEDEWHQEAVRRWGDGVPVMGSSIIDWELYVRSRLPTPPPPSSMDIMQERYAYDAWRLLVACTLMTRISSEKLKEETIAQFFVASPTPSALSASLAQGEGEQFQKLKQLLRPLGMVDSRIKTLTELSQCFLSMPAFDCGHQKGFNKIWGCGPFAVDSYLIFCRGQHIAETADSSCQSYLDWWCKWYPTVGCTQQQLPNHTTHLSPPKHEATISHKKRLAKTDVAMIGEPSGKGLHKFFKVANAE
mmetsp:Transcript_66945/g.131951  ORF Transcript_66945/g.131951 Transcript_66945/m.131951 type:complete len:336 (-) Transcript_66945:150-1157(-)